MPDPGTIYSGDHHRFHALLVKDTIQFDISIQLPALLNPGDSPGIICFHESSQNSFYQLAADTLWQYFAVIIMVQSSVFGVM